MKTFLVIGFIFFLIILFIFLKSYPKPSQKGIDLKLPEDKIPTEINSRLIIEYENVSITDENVNNKLADNEDLWNAWIKSG